MDWDIPQGHVLRRSEVHDRYGGSRQSGIATCAASPNILLFSTSGGSRYGYDFDGWQPDGSYHYTGAGQLGNQAMSRSNNFLYQHHEAGKTLRVFEGASKSHVRYVGAFELDRSQPFHSEKARDESNVERSVIVFHLLPLDVAPGQRPRNGSALEAKLAGLVEELPLEARLVGDFEVATPEEQRIARRRESELLHSYAAWLAGQGHVVVRNKITVPGSPSRDLYTDLFDKTTQELVEAKGGVTRTYIRMGLGQIFDYARKVEHRTRGLLVPSMPEQDLVELLNQNDVACIFPESHSFVRI
jgi:hypothetical protein